MVVGADVACLMFLVDVLDHGVIVGGFAACQYSGEAFGVRSQKQSLISVALFIDDYIYAKMTRA